MIFANVGTPNLTYKDDIVKIIFSLNNILEQNYPLNVTRTIKKAFQLLPKMILANFNFVFSFQVYSTPSFFLDNCKRWMQMSCKFFSRFLLDLLSKDENGTEKRNQTIKDESNK